MNRPARNALFMFFVAMFVIAAPTLILYAQGYRINWPLEPGKKLIVMTGGFYVETNPKQANIYVDEKLAEQTNFIFGQALIENLLPRQYQIDIKKTGYQNWSKTLEIKEKEVTEIRNVNLFPNRISFAAVEKSADKILASPDSSNIAIMGKDSDGWILKLYDTGKGVTSKLAEQIDFSPKDAEFNGWDWDGGSKILNVKMLANGTTTSYSILIEKNPPQISKIGRAATSTEEIAANETGESKYYLGADGSIFEKNGDQNTLKSEEAKMDIDPAAKYRLWVFGDYYFVSKNSDLYVKKPSADSFEKIFDNLASSLKLSPDSEKVAYSSDSEIWIFFIKNKAGQPGADEGTSLFIARLSEKIADCDWYNSDYLIFTAGGTIKTAEIDTRDRVNIAEIAKFSDISNNGSYPNSKLLWNRDQKSAYAYLGGSLYKSMPIE